MKVQMRVLTMKEIEFDLEMDKYFTDCINLLFKDKFCESNIVTKTVINRCKEIIKNDNCSDSELKNKALVVGILFRGIQNLIELHELTKSSNWTSQPKIVEKAWISLCDCKERINYASNCIASNCLTDLQNRIKYFENAFLEKYGHGVYMSPEILIKTLRCNICNKDLTSCEHISGAIYNGALCTGVVEEIIPENVSIVDNPKDFRCRIWPWNVNKMSENDSSNTVRAAILSSFRLDDFIYSD